MIRLLKAKLQKVKVTQANLAYKGSITIDQDLMEFLGIFPYEQAIINGIENRNDITYVLPGKRGSGIIGINGALSSKHKEGDYIHVLFFHDVNCVDIPENGLPDNLLPRIVETDENNKVK